MRSPHVQRFDRVADGHVPVHAHHRQGEGAGEHVVVVDGHHRLAQSIAEWPEAQKHIGALEIYTDIKQRTARMANRDRRCVNGVNFRERWAGGTVCGSSCHQRITFPNDYSDEQGEIKDLLSQPVKKGFI